MRRGDSVHKELRAFLRSVGGLTPVLGEQDLPMRDLVARETEHLVARIESRIPRAERELVFLKWSYGALLVGVGVIIFVYRGYPEYLVALVGATIAGGLAVLLRLERLADRHVALEILVMALPVLPVEEVVKVIQALVYSVEDRSGGKRWVERLLNR